MSVAPLPRFIFVCCRGSDIFREGLTFMAAHYPLADTLTTCFMSAQDAQNIFDATAAFAVPSGEG